MQILYADNLELSAVANQPTPFELVLGHIAQWLSRGATNALSPEIFSAAGTMELAPISVGNGPPITRVVSWEALDVGPMGACESQCFNHWIFRESISPRAFRSPPTTTGSSYALA